jgi:hypothetical protein
MSKPATTGRNRNGTFAPGNSGNLRGRPKGSRHKISEMFIAEVAADFEAHGRDVIIKVREERPEAYLRIVAGLLPKEMSIEAKNPLEDLSTEELDKMIVALVGEIAAPEGGEESDAADAVKPKDGPH